MVPFVSPVWVYVSVPAETVEISVAGLALVPP